MKKIETLLIQFSVIAYITKEFNFYENKNRNLIA